MQLSYKELVYGGIAFGALVGVIVGIIAGSTALIGISLVIGMLAVSIGQ